MEPWIWYKNKNLILMLNQLFQVAHIAQIFVKAVLAR